MLDKGKEIRVGSLANHGPFQDLIDLLNAELNYRSLDIVTAETAEDIISRQRRARGLNDAIRFIMDKVSYFASVHSLDKITL